MGIIEDLIKKGYDVKGPIKIDTDELTKMDFTTESINDTQREDKTVTVTSGDTTKRVSSMMFGYNKKKIKLKDGSFANADELLAAMQEAVRKQEAGTIIVNSKGEKLDQEQMEELIGMVAELAGKVTIGEQSPSIKNQEAPTWGVQGPNGVNVPKGAVFLGNGQIQLPSGEYISVDELNKALEEYMILVPKKKEEEPLPPRMPEMPEPDPESPMEPTPQIPEIQPNVMRVTTKYKNRLSIWLAILSIVLSTLLSLGIVEKPIEVMHEINDHMIEYQMDENVITKSVVEDIAQNIVNKYKMGEEVDIKDGQEFKVTSNPNETRTKTMGEEFSKEGKFQGKYRISGFAIWHDGNIYEFLEDFNGNLSDPSIGDYIDEMCTKHNLPKDEIDFMVHIGTNGGTRLGWIDVSELINAEVLDNAVIEYVQENAGHFFGIEKNLEGDIITLSNGDKVKINDNIKPGDVLVGESGTEYTVNQFDVTTETRTETETVGVDKQIVFDLTAPEIAISVAPLIAALGFGLINRKKNKDAKENPSFVSVNNPEQRDKFIKEFEKAKEEYEKKSSFAKLKDILYRKEIDQLQELTVEQVEELYSAIERHANRDFVLGENDNIKIKNGKILIEYHDGGVMDITDIVIADVNKLGASEPEVAEGLYTDEIRRKY